MAILLPPPMLCPCSFALGATAILAGMYIIWTLQKGEPSLAK
jgi:hypothetical protein